uniref:Uncharacterized protein n=1 Tax=Serinus canaria TaxID=9135 RepID=A0A8C9KYS2_SERCA
ASWLTWDVPPGALFGFQNHMLRSHSLWSRPEAILKVAVREMSLYKAVSFSSWSHFLSPGEQNDLCSLQEAPGGTKTSQGVFNKSGIARRLLFL